MRCNDSIKSFVLDTNVLIHDPDALLNFAEHNVIVPMTVLEELDSLKSGKKSVSMDCRQAIRLIDKLLGDASPDEVEKGVPIFREATNDYQGTISILMSETNGHGALLPEHINDNKIINALAALQNKNESLEVILVSKDINMRLKARGFGVAAEDYHNDQLVDDVNLLSSGYTKVEGSFWDSIEKVNSSYEGATYHLISNNEMLNEVSLNDYLLDDNGFVGRVSKVLDQQTEILELNETHLLKQEAWGLVPRDIYQAFALNLLLDESIDLVTLTGAAGSGKTILALAAALELTISNKKFSKIIVTRSTEGLDKDIGFLPGTEEEKMEPWLGAIVDNIEALHEDDESTPGSIDYILQKVPIQFKSLNYIRGRSFQNSFIIIDECQNLTPHQMKTIITRAGKGSKVCCIGNLNQIDTPYLNPLSSGLTYLAERFKRYPRGGQINLQGVPRSPLAEYAECHL